MPNQPLTIEATIDYPQLVRYAGVIYKSGTSPARAVPFQRGLEQRYVAVIPAEAVVSPSIGYTIEIERVDGTREAIFASRNDMHQVQVIEDRMDARERALYERLQRRRSVASAGGEFVQFGVSRGQIGLCPDGSFFNCEPSERQVPEVSEQFWRVELKYTYRPLRTIAEFSLRGGVVRGKSLVGGTLDTNKYKVGLNYGAPSVRFRLADAWHIEAEFLTSITEVGFSVGLGSSVIIGDPYGSRLTMGFETIGLDSSTYFGSRFFSRMDIVATDRITVAPIIEVTDMPHSQRFGVRLLGEASVELGGGFGVAVQGGYQAREAASGGVGLGGNVFMAF